MDCREYQLNVEKIFRYALQIAPEQKIVYAPPRFGEIEYTYREFAERVNRLGNFLEELGVKAAASDYEMDTRAAVMDWNTTRYQELMVRGADVRSDTLHGQHKAGPGGDKFHRLELPAVPSSNSPDGEQHKKGRGDER